MWALYFVCIHRLSSLFIPTSTIHFLHPFPNFQTVDVQAQRHAAVIWGENLHNLIDMPLCVAFGILVLILRSHGDTSCYVLRSCMVPRIFPRMQFMSHIHLLPNKRSVFYCYAIEP